MTNFIPIFPLDVIVYPGETLNLHIFEPRYKQLIKDCLTDRKPFGIPVSRNGDINDLGSLIEITEMVKEYDNGEMDIRTKALEVFKVLEVIKEIPDKLYQGAIVNYPVNTMEPGDSRIALIILTELKDLFALLNLETKKFPDDKTAMISYDIAHFVGLSKEQEYELLGIFTEIQRLEYLRRHLNAIAPTIKELEKVKARVQMNGHFRNLSLDDL